MNLFKISWKNIWHKPMNTALSVVLLAFGVGIISLLLLMEEQLTSKFNRNIKDIDMVLGAKGSPMQLILANVYHVDAPTGNIKVKDAQRIIKSPLIKEAIPLAYGDNFQNWRIVGTNEKYPNHYECKIVQGQMFSAPFEATIGSNVAKESGLKLGDTFISTHGFDQKAESDEDGHHHDNPYTVKGIFEESNCAIDNLILTPVESVWMVHEHAHDEEGHHEGEDHHEGEEQHDEKTHQPEAEDHDHEEHDHAEEGQHDPDHESAELADHADHDHSEEQHGHEGETADHAEEHAHEADESEREMTAYLLVKRNASALMMLPNSIKDTNMQLALPAIEVNRLSQNFGLGMGTMKAIAIFIMLLSFISIFISLFNSLKERKYELALMRTMGGTRATLSRLILQEGVILVILGFTLGLILSRVGLLVLSNMLKENFHYSMSNIGFTMNELVLFGITLLVGIVASLLPAVKALKMDISKTLGNG
jgi:putative ABC transport system permease protein